MHINIWAGTLSFHTKESSIHLFQTANCFSILVQAVVSCLWLWGKGYVPSSAWAEVIFGRRERSEITLILGRNVIKYLLKLSQQLIRSWSFWVKWAVCFPKWHNRIRAEIGIEIPCPSCWSKVTPGKLDPSITPSGRQKFKFFFKNSKCIIWGKLFQCLIIFLYSLGKFAFPAVQLSKLELQFAVASFLYPCQPMLNMSNILANR